jgi:hypothetical protein
VKIEQAQGVASIMTFPYVLKLGGSFDRDLSRRSVVCSNCTRLSCVLS